LPPFSRAGLNPRCKASIRRLAHPFGIRFAAYIVACYHPLIRHHRIRIEFLCRHLRRFRFRTSSLQCSRQPKTPSRLAVPVSSLVTNKSSVYHANPPGYPNKGYSRRARLLRRLTLTEMRISIRTHLVKGVGGQSVRRIMAVGRLRSRSSTPTTGVTTAYNPPHRRDSRSAKATSTS